MSAPGGIPKTWVILLNGGMTEAGDTADAAVGKNRSPVSRRLARIRAKATGRFCLP